MEFLDEALRKEPPYRVLRQAVAEGMLPGCATGLSRVHKAHVIHTLCLDTGQGALVITADEGEASRLREDLANLGTDALLYPARDFALQGLEGVSKEYEHRRIGVLTALLSQPGRVVVCPADAAVQWTIPKETLRQRTIVLREGQQESPALLIERLLASGYIRCELVEGAGQFAARGGILDVFPIGWDKGARIEFWGNEIDSMAAFDPVDQRRIDRIQELRIPPAGEVLFDSMEDCAELLSAFAEGLSKKQEAAKENILADAARLRDGVRLSSYDKYIALAYEKPASIFDYCGGLLLICDHRNIRDRQKSFYTQQNEDIKALLEQGKLAKGVDCFSLQPGEFAWKLERGHPVFLETFVTGGFDTPLQTLCSFTLRQRNAFMGSLEQLREDLAPVLENGTVCAVLAGGERAASALAADLSDMGIPALYAPNPRELRPGQVTVTTGALSASVEYPAAGLLLLAQSRNTGKTKKYKRPKNAAFIGSIDELKRGDYVVHAAHGIGVFDGIHKIETQGVVKDYIKINYKGADVLYVPVTQLDLVSKYIGSSEESAVRVNKLGGTEWHKTRSRVRGAVKDMAKQLIALYAKRMQQKGFAFSEDTEIQRDFEQKFEYEETDDQLRCAAEIKGDMERPVPMDRLLCGDVGFGKTEVALRAAFKCVTEGKQCAILVPTTILAWQHYQTVSRRMAGTGVRAELLSRFCTPAQQAKTVKELKRGNVDIVIGTHRLISGDVGFRDLGLLIVDEEQRFGVGHKEKLKELYPAVDVLTLSATPIPRTLNMAMSGLRDMSIIEEAPGDRLPVQTYVMEYDSGVLLDAIRRELRRGGQVYYLHNRVESIEKTAVRIQSQLDGARVAVAHGQMGEDELSRVWQRLVEQEIDVLVCTTIIETGVDVPTANTLIIEDCDRMGLSQLHQIRGRVGRSPRRAYAYFTFRRGKALSDVAQKRLEAIREFTEFGAGFKIAMRDLQIRGAGNILGAQQHGNMEAVGYDMYLKLLSDAVAEEKGEKPKQDVECTVDLPVTAHIPESYIESLPARLGIYRRIADIRTQDDVSDVLDELIDRFGEPPAEVKGLIDIAILRNRAAACGFFEIAQRDGSLLLYPRQLDMEQAGRLAAWYKGRIMVGAGAKPYISLRLLPGEEAAKTLGELLFRLFSKEEKQTDSPMGH